VADLARKSDRQSDRSGHSLLNACDLLGCPAQRDRLAGFWPHNIAQQRLSLRIDEQGFASSDGI
jgi:hypothetical protein